MHSDAGLWCTHYLNFYLLLFLLYMTYFIIIIEEDSQLDLNSQELRALLLNLAYVLDKMLISESCVWLKQSK